MYTRDCEGLHYFKDENDDEEYIYSQFEAACAHKVFPCFDQPDLKAPYSLLVFAPNNWNVISTTKTLSVTSKNEELFFKATSRFSVGGELYGEFGDQEFRAHEF